MSWLSGWSKRVKITISNANVDETLSDFPLLVYLSASSGTGNTDVSCIFDELASDANRFKIAVTTSDGETECYVEIERWDDANEKAWLWVKVPSVSASAETELYIYYDSSHADNMAKVGDIDSTPGQNVWDSNFKLVCHMRDNTTSEVKDSTSNGNDGTKGAANNPLEVAGKVDKAQDFDGGDFIDNSDDILNTQTIGTIEAIIKIDTLLSENAAEIIYGIADDTDANGLWGFEVYGLSSTETRLRVIRLTPQVDIVYGSDDLAALTEYHVALTGNDTTWVFYVNGIADGSPVVASGSNNGAWWDEVISNVAQYSTGVWHRSTGDIAYYHGLIDELRISNSVRSAAWLKATKHSLWDNLVSYGTEEIKASWLSGWSNRVKISLDKNQVDEVLTDFPVMLNLSTSSGTNNADVSYIFDELTSDANRFKIAVTTSDGVTQCYVEIEKWDQANEQAWLHVKVPSVSNSENTEIYLYFDASHADNTTYVGDIASTPGHNVWDSSFKLVCHMQDATTSTVKDSTSNGNDGTKKAANEPAEATGKVDKCQDHDGSDDYISFAIAALSTGDYTIETLYKTEASSLLRMFSPSTMASSGVDLKFPLILYDHSNARIDIQRNTAGGYYFSYTTDNDWHNLAILRTSGMVSAYQDGAAKSLSTRGTDYSQDGIDFSDTSFFINRLYYNSNNYYSMGLRDEIRISNIARSAAWIKATKHSLWDNIASYGTKETSSSSDIVDCSSFILTGNLIAEVQVIVHSKPIDTHHWAEDIKGQLPWELDPITNKITYNEGNKISSVANPIWSIDYEFSGVPITSKHNPCGYWNKGPSGGEGGYVIPPSPIIHTPDSWTRMAEFPGVGRTNTNHSAAAIGTKVYVGFGCPMYTEYGDPMLADWWEYDSLQDTWTQKASLYSTLYYGFSEGDPPCGRSEAVVVSCGNKIYAGLGLARDSDGEVQHWQYKDWYEYDPSLDTWTRKADYTGLGGYTRSAAVASVNGKIYVGTGVSGGYPFYRGCWREYDPETDVWTSVSSVGYTLYCGQAVDCNNKVYFGGGYNNETTYQWWKVYDPVTDSWTWQTSLPMGPCHHFAAGRIGNKIYAGTGIGVSVFDNWYEFDPSENLWTERTPFSGGTRAAAAVASTSNNRIYMGLGSGTEGYMTDWWMYTPPT